MDECPKQVLFVPQRPLFGHQLHAVLRHAPLTFKSLGVGWRLLTEKLPLLFLCPHVGQKSVVCVCVCKILRPRRAGNKTQPVGVGFQWLLWQGGHESSGGVWWQRCHLPTVTKPFPVSPAHGVAAPWRPSQSSSGFEPQTPANHKAQIK